MISAIIIVGISFKLAIILVLIRSSIGFSAMYQRLKKVIGVSQVEQDVNYLARGLILECEARSVQFASESVEETTLLEEPEKAEAAPTKVQSFFRLMKQKIDSSSPHASESKPRTAEAFEGLLEHSQARGPLQQLLPDWQVCSPVDVVSKVSPPEDLPTVPASMLPALDSSLQRKHYAGLPGLRGASLSGVQRGIPLTPISHNKKPANGNPRIRSKLAVKLEKKLESLDSRVSLASTLPRREVLLQKLDRLIRNHSRKLAQKGKAALPVIVEDELAISN